MVDLKGNGFHFHIESSLAPLLSQLGEFLTQQGVEGYLVGGYVRDVLLGRNTRDIDIAVKGDALKTAYQVASILGGAYVPLDKVNRVARVVLAEASHKGDAWHLDFSTIMRHVEEDLLRRDFTVNALAASLTNWEGGGSELLLLDPLGGRKDLEGRLVRAVSATIFVDDPARLLRAVRLAAEMNFIIEKGTEALIQKQSYLVARVAGERVREELYRLLSCPRSAFFLRYLDRLRLLGTIMPELAETKGVQQPKEHFWDVFEHSLETVAATEFLLRIDRSEYPEESGELVPWSPALVQHFEEEFASGVNRKVLMKLGALLHDVAKPQCKTVERNGRMRFLGHAKEGARIAGQILERLKFSNREREIVPKLIEYHLRPGQLSSEGELPTRRAIYRYFKDTGEEGIDILFLGLADHLATGGHQVNLSSWREHTQLVEYILAERRKQLSLVAPPRFVTGHDLMRLFELSPGPLIGELLEAVKEAQASREITTREEALALVQQLLNTRQG